MRTGAAKVSMFASPRSRSMSYFQTPGGTLEDQAEAEAQTQEQDPDRDPGQNQDSVEDEQEPTKHRTAPSWLLDVRVRIAGAFASFERSRVDQPALAGGEETTEPVVPQASDPDLGARFPVGAFGYNRAAVEDYIVELEREISELRRELPSGMSIGEEIERLGEQTASILVVAHDRAHDTTRRAQEQADRCIANAASNAVAITEQAKRDLRELDTETDSVWQERSRLLDDARTTGAALIALADEAAERFPADTKAGFEVSNPRPG